MNKMMAPEGNKTSDYTVYNTLLCGGLNEHGPHRLLHRMLGAQLVKLFGGRIMSYCLAGK